MIFYKGDKVKHKKRDEWGLGEIIEIGKEGTIVVNFENHQEVSIASGKKFLVKVDKSGNPIKEPEKFTAGDRVFSEEHRKWGVGKVLEDSIGV